jgi:hypothetical protein
MDLVTVLSVLALVAAFGAWFWPRAPTTTAPELPQPILSSEPSKGLKVRLAFGFLTFNHPPWLSDDQMLLVSVANPQPRPIRVISVGLEFEGDGRTMPWLTPGSERSMPFVLAETEQNQFWLPLREIGQAMCKNGLTDVRRARAFVRDSYDEQHLSDWVDCDAKDWVKTK